MRKKEYGEERSDDEDKEIHGLRREHHIGGVEAAK